MPNEANFQLLTEGLSVRLTFRAGWFIIAIRGLSLPAQNVSHSELL